MRQLSRLRRLAVATSVFTTTPLVRLTRTISTSVILPRILSSNLHILSGTLPMLIRDMVVHQRLRVLAFHNNTVLTRRLLQRRLRYRRAMKSILYRRPIGHISCRNIQHVTISSKAINSNNHATSFRTRAIRHTYTSHFTNTYRSTLQRFIHKHLNRQRCRGLFKNNTFYNGRPYSVSSSNDNFTNSHTHGCRNIIAYTNSHTSLLITRFILFSVTSSIAHFISTIN